MISRGRIPRFATLLTSVIRRDRASRLLATLLLLASVLAPVCRAAELQLRNGDRVTGEITRRSEGRIHLQSAIFGNIVIPESDVTSILDPQIDGRNPTDLRPAATQSTGPDPLLVTKPAPRSDGQEVAGPGTSLPPAPLPSGTTAAASSAGSAAATSGATPGRWRGTVEFGFQQEAGRREGISTSLRADTERERGPNQLKVNVRSLYSQLDDQLISERSDASFRWRRQLSNRVFAQSVTSFLSDNVKEIDQNYEQNAGFGYALIKRDRHVVNVGGGVTGQVRDALKMSQGFAVLGEIFEDYSFRINSRLTFVQDFLAQYSPVSRGNALLREGDLIAASGEIRNYRIRVNSALQGRVTDSISMNLRFEYDLDNTVIEQSAKADQRLISSIGYAF